MTAVVSLESVSRRYGARTVLDGVSFDVAEGDTLALLGPSGSGKTTTLRLIAGLEPIDAGRILLAGMEASSPRASMPPEKRRVGFVFQSFALFPHLSVEDNVAFGARDRSDIDALLALVDLAPRRAARVHTLSGGEQQRVALIRALAIHPRVVLLDEPFANLDAALRRRIRDELARTLRARGATSILVTHDAAEAFVLADRVAVMSDGAILQLGAPEDVYLRPRTLEIARRTGEVVTLRGRLTGNGTVTTCLGELAIAGTDESSRGELAIAGTDVSSRGELAIAGTDKSSRGEVIVALRPEQIVVDPAGVRARVRARAFEGSMTTIACELDGESLQLRAAGHVAAAIDDMLPLAVRPPVRVYPSLAAG
ncbi:MAG: ABC transporter ATP-binding protein [Kofleriaceae bacterium]